MSAGRRADIDDLRLGNRAIGKDRKIAPAGQDVRGAPVHLDDAALGRPVDTDPVASSIRSAEAQYDPGKDVAQRALQREAQDDRDDAGGRQQPLNW